MSVVSSQKESGKDFENPNWNSLQQLKLFDNDKEINCIHRPRHSPQENISKRQHVDKRQKENCDENNIEKKCMHCGNKHPKQKCLAFGRQCNKCKKFNHYAKMCHSSGKLNSIETKGSNNGSNQEEVSDDFLFLDTIQAAINETRINHNHRNMKHCAWTILKSS